MSIRYLFLKIGQFVSLALPENLAYRAAIFAADMKRILLPMDRITVRDNLIAVLGRRDVSHETKWVFRNFALYLVDFFRSPKIDKDFISKHIEFVGIENLDKALSEGKGVIGLSAHIGNWELGAASLGILGYDINAVAMVHKSKRVNRFFNDTRSSKGFKTIPLGKALRSCIEVLKRNGILALVGDKNFGPNGITVKFFGRDCLLPKGPAFFHIKMGSPIVPVFMVRTHGDRFKMIFEEPMRFNSTGDEERDLISITSDYLKVIERYVKLYPEQWFMFRRFWE
ncbi:MAG: hypothetical protein AUJ75_02530 [Candidatus Omnitrophica bacterium CG1_02_49_10]|nr:MAG: hypothetical protein AUJ75_02530 [Candidatus Omnitrophica bacterium CG1_02_49_10]